MIRKPPADWNRPHEGPAIRTIRTAAVVAQSGAGVARRGGQVVRGLLCYFFAALWGLAAIVAGLAGDLPSLIGVGAMAAVMFWVGSRAFAKARAASG
jgi:hypothetical protein